MDYDDIDYDEDYSMRDINNNWLNSNMDYDETDSVNVIIFIVHFSFQHLNFFVKIFVSFNCLTWIHYLLEKKILL